MNTEPLVAQHTLSPFKQTATTTMTDLIVDFPQPPCSAVCSNTLQVRIMKRHEDARHEL